MPIVWDMPDGSVVVTTLADHYLERERQPGETTDQAVLRLALDVQKKLPSLAGGTPSLLKRAEIPVDRKRRHAWRVKNGKIHVDPAVPDPPSRP